MGVYSWSQEVENPLCLRTPLWRTGDWKGRLLAPHPSEMAVRRRGQGNGITGAGAFRFQCVESMKGPTGAVKAYPFAVIGGFRSRVFVGGSRLGRLKCSQLRVFMTACERVVTHVRPPSSIFGYPDTPSLRYPRNPHETAGSTTNSQFAWRGPAEKEAKTRPIASPLRRLFSTNLSSYLAIYPSLLRSQSWIFSSVAAFTRDES